jgi:hypothetical protein
MALINNTQNRSRDQHSERSTTQISSRHFVLVDDTTTYETALVNNSQPPPYDDHPPTLDGVKSPNNWGHAWFFGISTVYPLHLSSIEGHTDIRCIYQRGRLELHSLEDAPETLGLINIGYLEFNTLLRHIQLRHLITWVLHRELERIIVAKILRTVLPELFGSTLPQPTYRVLSEDEYLTRETYHNCTCSCNH